MPIEFSRYREVERRCTKRAALHMHSWVWMALSGVVMLLPATFAGCSRPPDGPKRLPISGTVTREGIPVDDGSILFAPVGAGVGVSGEITDGKYSFTTQNGVPVGKYKVTINQHPLVDKTQGMGRQGPPLPDNRFKKKQPKNGWLRDAEVIDDPKQKIDFALDPL